MTTNVDFTTNLGDIVIQLDTADAPNTVADFLSYAENMTVGQGYTDTFLSRLVPGFVLQGGGYYVNPTNTIQAVTTLSPVAGEYNPSIPDVIGTVSLALPSGTNGLPDQNAGTDQFFINLANNTNNLQPGFTVFGLVTSASLPVVEQIAALPVDTTTFPAPLNQLPLLTKGPVTTSNLVTITKVTVTTDNTPFPVIPCFADGTRIETARGMVAVEDVRVGDVCATASGDGRTVVWVGDRRVDVARHPWPDAVLPVRIAAGAFGDGVPARDVWLSPDHAVFVDGALIPARCLVDGVSIVVDALRPRLTYHHIELDAHDVILAEGLPVESFLDCGNRSQFAGGARVSLHADFAGRAWEALSCAPLVVAGPLVAAARARVAERVGLGSAARVARVAVR